MAKFVIHKNGFYYTDEAFELEKGAKGSIVGVHNSLEEAKAEKEKHDIISLQNLKGMSVVDFFFYSKKYDEVYQKLEDLYKVEYNSTIEDKYSFSFPDQISEQQAKEFLKILEVSFHNIVEYGDDEELDPEMFNLEEEELGEF